MATYGKEQYEDQGANQDRQQQERVEWVRGKTLIPCSLDRVKTPDTSAYSDVTLFSQLPYLRTPPRAFLACHER